MSSLDLFVLFSYLLGTTALSWWLGRQQKDSRDYFVGSGQTSWWVIMVSIVATETSSLTFISVPGLAYLTDLTFVQIALGYLLGRFVVCYTLLPLYFRGEAVTAYALLEKRFGKGARRMASLTFMTTRIFGDSVRIYATAIPIALLMGPLLPAEWQTPVAVVVLGVISLAYTYQGGMKSVIWTDVLQTAVYLAAAFVALYLLGTHTAGGWSGIISSASDAGKLRLFDFSLGLDKPHTLLAGLIGGGVLAMASHGADQLFVQRLLSAGNLNSARKALIGSGVMVIGQMLLFLMIGIGLYEHYQGVKFASPDQVFPKFIFEEMPHGLIGLVVAAILAASTASGTLTSLAAATLHDILLPLRKEPMSDADQLRLSKKLTLVWAAILTCGALMYTDKQTPVVTVALSIASFTYGGLLGSFALALLWPRAKQRDAIVGMALGMSLTALIVFAKPLSGYVSALQVFVGIAWPWFVLMGTGLTFGVGVVSSMVFGEAAQVKELSQVEGVPCES